MDRERMAELLRAQEYAHERRVREAQVSERYYANQTDIKRLDRGQPGVDKAENPIRQADNRISHRWHGLMVDQKAGYIATYPPMIDLGSKGKNKRLLTLLGDNWRRDFHRLVVQATNAGIGWLHVWEGEMHREFGVVDAKQVIPLYTGGLQHQLCGVIRRYGEEDGNGKSFMVVEHWDSENCTVWRRQGNSSPWEEYPCFGGLDGFGEASNTYAHRMGRVPFIPFPNNLLEKGDLQLLYKDLVDVYDRVASGFADDIEDIQQLIFVIQNYGGENLSEFLGDLKRYKAIKVQNDGMGTGGGVSTLAIDIPVEARNSLLEELRRDILTFGQGVDPDPEKLGNVTGVALRHKYGLLELKAGALETEFRPGVAQLARMLMGLPEDAPVLQTWTRNMVQNDLEQAQVVQMLSGVTSQRTMDENNPLVDDADEEERRRRADEERLLARAPQQEPELFQSPEEPDEA